MISYIVTATIIKNKSAVNMIFYIVTAAFIKKN